MSVKSNKIKIAFFDAKPYDIETFNNLIPNYDVEIKYYKHLLDINTASLAKGADVICTFVNDKIDKNIIDFLVENEIPLVAQRSAGYNNIDLKYARRKIHVVRVPAYSPNAVAEHALALMFTLNRKTHKAYNRTRDGNFSLVGLTGFDMKGKTIGIIGTGNIGKILAKTALGIGMKVIAYDAFPDKKFEEDTGLQYTSLSNLVKTSDIISLHCPLTKDTFHMIDEEAISSMKNRVMIINTSRGALIDTRALINGLKTEKIGFAGLDVYEEEDKYFFEDFSDRIISDDQLARLLTFKNVLITSHQAFLTREALDQIAITTLENITGFFKNNILKNEICYQCGAPVCNKKVKGKCF
ncbi:MAG: 2-hydroxyacid dehydrogenase [Deltaproteobacteria bacterium]|nr:2-hydroxyacid dehydrogenase [Deltaproteobacteria bacterium]